MAVTTEAAIKREAARIRMNFDNPNRYFAYTKESRDSYEKEFKYINGDIKLEQFAKDLQLVVSDCYILYAVASLGCTDLEGIRLFLSAMSNRNKDLSIASMKAKDVSSVRHRVRRLMECGMLFKHRYQISAEVQDDGMLASLDEEGQSSAKNKVSLYTITKSAQTLTNNKLGRHTVIDEWIQARPLYELMGWASCAYVAGRIAGNKAYIEQKQGVFNTRVAGTVIMPGILRMASSNSAGEAYVGIYPAFLHLDKSIKTEEIFEEDCQFMIKRMKQYFYSQDVKKRLARLVIVVEDNSDLVQMTRRIHANGSLIDDYDRLFFTGEGAVRLAKTSKLTGCFLRMQQDNSENGYSFAPVTPDFIL